MPRENYESFQSELERIRQLKDNSLLQNTENLPCSKDAPETKEKKQSPEFESQNLLLQTLSNADKLIENLDIKGMIDMFEKQTKRNDQLQKIIEEKNTVIHELEMKIQSLNVSKTGPPPNTENKNQNKQDDITWSRPKKSIKPTFPPTWEKTTTENRFKSLSYLSDEQITHDHAASLDIQMQNIKLQRQVQFLKKKRC